MSGMFQRDNCECLAIPSVKNRKHRKTGDMRPLDISQIGSFKPGCAPTLRILHQLKNQFLSCPDKFYGHLRTSVFEANAVAVVAEAPVKRRMNA